MTSKSISQLPDGGEVTASNLIPNVQIPGVGPVKTTADQLRTFTSKITATGTTTEISLQDRFGEMKTFRDFGAVGDGVTDDTAAVQAAFNQAGYVSGTTNDVYAIYADIFIPSNTFFDGNGSKFLRKYTNNGYLINNASSLTTHDDVNIHLNNLSVEDDGTINSRGCFVNLSGINGFSLNNFTSYSRSPEYLGRGAVALLLASSNGTVSNVNIDSYNKLVSSYFADGIHFGYCENVTLNGGTIQCYDDAIALFGFGASYPTTVKDAPSKNIAISNLVLKSGIGHGIRIGAWGSAYLSTNLNPQKQAWQNVAISNIVIKESANGISLYDDRKNYASGVSVVNLYVGMVCTIESLNDGLGGSNTDFTLFGSPNNSIGTTFTVTSIPASKGTGKVSNNEIFSSSTEVSASNIITDYMCVITSVGNTDFTLIGAASNTIGTYFRATSAGSGTGKVILFAPLQNENISFNNIVMENELGVETNTVGRRIYILGYYDSYSSSNLKQQNFDNLVFGEIIAETSIAPPAQYPGHLIFVSGVKNINFNNCYFKQDYGQVDVELAIYISRVTNIYFNDTKFVFNNNSTAIYSTLCQNLYVNNPNITGSTNVVFGLNGTSYLDTNFYMFGGIILNSAYIVNRISSNVSYYNNFIVEGTYAQASYLYTNFTISSGVYHNNFIRPLYGFYSDVPNTGGRYSIYSAGLAPNYFAGNSYFQIGTRFGSTLAPNNTVDITGSFGRGPLVMKTSDFAVGDTENWIEINNSGTTTVTLPNPTTFAGREIMIKTVKNQLVVASAPIVQSILGGALQTGILNAVSGSWAVLVADAGGAWVIMQGVGTA